MVIVIVIIVAIVIITILPEISIQNTIRGNVSPSIRTVPNNNYNCYNNISTTTIKITAATTTTTTTTTTTIIINKPLIKKLDTPLPCNRSNFVFGFLLLFLLLLSIL